MEGASRWTTSCQGPCIGGHCQTCCYPPIRPDSPMMRQAASSNCNNMDDNMNNLNNNNSFARAPETVASVYGGGAGSAMK